MRCSATILSLFDAIAAATDIRVQYPSIGPGYNWTNISVVTTGTYEILRAEILQTTVNVTAGNSPIQTSREDFKVVTQGINSGALPVQCSAGWVSIFATYPVVVPLSCADPNVNATLLQGEVWPEDGGFYLFVGLNNTNPAAWMVGDHLSTSAGWNYEPVTNATWPPGGHWVWSGNVIIDEMPTLSLEEWIGLSSSIP